MKKIVFILAVVLTSFAVQAQSKEQNQPKESKVNYSLAWGLFKSKNYPKENTAKFEFEKPEFRFDAQVDTTKYEQKSALWGAIQWTEKKKEVSKKSFKK